MSQRCSCIFCDSQSGECSYRGICVYKDMDKKLEKMKQQLKELKEEKDAEVERAKEFLTNAEANLIIMLTDDEWVEVINAVKEYCANTNHGSFSKLEKTFRVVQILETRYNDAYNRKFRGI